MRNFNDYLNENLGNLKFLGKKWATPLINNVNVSGKDSKVTKLGVVKNFNKLNSFVNKEVAKDKELYHIFPIALAVRDTNGKVLAVVWRYGNERKWTGYTLLKVPGIGPGKKEITINFEGKLNDLWDKIENMLPDGKAEIRLVSPDPVRIEKRKERAMLNAFSDKNFDKSYWGEIEPKFEKEKVRKALRNLGFVARKERDIDDAWKFYMQDVQEHFDNGIGFRPDPKNLFSKIDDYLAVGRSLDRLRGSGTISYSEVKDIVRTLKS